MYLGYVYVVPSKCQTFTPFVCHFDKTFFEPFYNTVAQLLFIVFYPLTNFHMILNNEIGI